MFVYYFILGIPELLVQIDDLPNETLTCKDHPDVLDIVMDLLEICNSPQVVVANGALDKSGRSSFF